MTATTLLAQLRSAGVLIGVRNGRLILEAPRGVITADLRSKIVEHRAELISALVEQPVNSNEDSIASDARRVIAGLLASAYRRYAVNQSRRTAAGNQGTEPLAIPPDQSVHGVVP